MIRKDLLAAEMPVSGMDCDSCVVTIQAGLGGLGGVEDVRVNLDEGTVRLRYDATRCSLSTIEAAIAGLGFDAGGGTTAGHYRIPRPVIFAVIGLALPFLVLFRDRAGYTPDALYIPGGLDTGRFDQIALLPIGLAFLLGVLVFFSPTILAMSSVVVGYSASSSGHSRLSALKTAAGFAVGTLVVDATVGAAFGAAGREAIRFFTARLPAWNLLLGLVLVATGLALLRVWKIASPTFAPRLGEARGFRGALLVGAPFALLDCPGCTPLLLPVALGAAATGSPFYGAAVLGAYGLGRGVLLMGLGASTGFAKTARWFRRWVPVVEALSGAALLGAGLYFLKEFLRLSSFGGL